MSRSSSKKKPSPKSKRFVTIWRNKFLTLDAKTIEDVISGLRNATEVLDAMRADGVVLDPDGGTEDDYAILVTTDPDVAERHRMVEEEE